MNEKRSNLHLPVMVDEVLEYLVTNRSGAYLDLTAGMGGHLKALSRVLHRESRLYGLDRDPKAVDQARVNLHDCPQLRAVVCSSYSDVESVVEQLDDRIFDGILLDLGISSVQLDDAGRGFSFRFDGPLDMRFDAQSGQPTAADLINTLSEKKLTEIMRDFGEERKADRLARAMIKERNKGMILTTAQLTELVRREVFGPHLTKSLARVFQAFRIAVNRELDHLTDVLPKAVSLLKSGGRFAVISYHSLEDRLVKQFFRQQAKGCICPDEFDACVCGVKPSLTIITKKALKPQENELEQNPRSRSARLRVAEKI